MIVEVRILVTPGRYTDRERAQVPSGMMDTLYILVWILDMTVIYIYTHAKISSSLKIYAL